MFRFQKADRNTVVRAGVGVIARDNKSGCVLLERRSDCGLWGIPGGRIEPGESIVDSATREMKEETGLDVKITGLFGVYSEQVGRIVTFPDCVVHLVDTIVEAEIMGGELKCSSESLEIKYFRIEEFPEDIVPPAQSIIRDIKSNRKYCLR
jgi:ADP-ribose pyrophosphatase YjhB (NUDIX family)